jgi:cell division protein FtsQ
MNKYLEMVRDLDAGDAHYSQDLSEVDLSDLEDVKVRVNDPQGDVLVHLGSSDYLQRYRIYVSHAQGWRQQFQKLESVDLRYDNQIVVNPDIERVAKESPLSAASAKLAANAGVKPAALITRLPNDRSVPKPAFQLTQKQLDAATEEEKKQTAKPKAGKIAVAPAKAVSPATNGATTNQVTTKPATTNQVTKNQTTKPVPIAKLGKTTAKKKSAHAISRRPAAKKTAKQNANATTKPAPGAHGQKPSAAIAKTQNNDPPSD